MAIIRATPEDLPSIDALRRALWPDSPIEELMVRAPDMVGSAPHCLVLIARTDDGTPIAFAETALRVDYVNGCDGSPVAFLEGIYVDPAHRRTGIARALVEEAMNWGRERGAIEFASDALLDNLESHAFHAAIGIEETERVVYFRRPIVAARS